MADNKQITPTDSGTGKRNALLGNAYILFAIILFSVNIPVVKILIPEWMNASDVTIVRLVGGGLLFWIASLFIRRGKVDKHDLPLIMLGGGLTLFAFIYLLNIALKYGNPIDVAILMTLPPAYIILYQIIFKHMKPHWLEVAGMVVAFAGAVIVIVCGHESKHASNPLLGDLFGILSGVAYMAYLVILEKPTHKYHPISMLKWVFLGSAIPCLFICWSMHSAPIFHTPHISFTPWLCVIFLAAGPSFLAYLLVNPAIKMIGSELVSIYQYFMPVVTTIVAVILGQAVLEWQECVAMAIIIIGMVLTNIGNRKKRKELAAIGNKE